MKTILATVVLLASITAHSQDNYGFYGKKTYIEVTSSSYIPLFYNLTTLPGYKRISESSNTLRETENWFHMGLRASVGHTVKSNLGIALEVGYDQFSVNDQLIFNIQNPDGSNNSWSVKNHERVQINSILIMPKIEIAGSNGLLPNGLVHQIGVGFTINNPVEKEYVVNLQNDSSWNPIPSGFNPDLSDEIDLTRSYKMFRLMYGLKMRTPIGKSLMINYGFRYNFDLGITPIGYPQNLARAIRRYQFRNVIAFDLGLTVPF